MSDYKVLFYAGIVICIFYIAFPIILSTAPRLKTHCLSNRESFDVKEHDSLRDNIHRLDKRIDNLIINHK